MVLGPTTYPPLICSMIPIVDPEMSPEIAQASVMLPKNSQSELMSYKCKSPKIGWTKCPEKGNSS